MGEVGFGNWEGSTLVWDDPFVDCVPNLVAAVVVLKQLGMRDPYAEGGATCQWQLADYLHQ